MGLLTLEEVAIHLRVTKKTVYRLLEKGDIPAIKLGHLWRFDSTSIDMWLHQKSVDRTAKILVIDDDESICSLFKDALEASRHVVTTVNDSIKGLELVKNQNYDLVFLDLKMPGIDGVEVLRRIKEIMPDLPVTIITGYPDGNVMANALAYGPLGVMSKPFRGSDILSAVDNYLRFGYQVK